MTPDTIAKSPDRSLSGLNTPENALLVLVLRNRRLPFIPSCGKDSNCMLNLMARTEIQDAWANVVLAGALFAQGNTTQPAKQCATLKGISETHGLRLPLANQIQF